MSDRVDGPRERDANREMVPCRDAFHRVGAAARRFTHNRGALLRLQVESEFFTSGKGLMRSEYVNGLINKSWTRKPGSRPELVPLIVVAILEIVNVRRLPEQIRNHEIDHVRIATVVLPQVKDQGIAVRQKTHCRYDCRSTNIRRGKRTELDVANIVAEDFYFGKSTVLIFQHAAKPCLLSGTRLAPLRGRTGLHGYSEGIVGHVKMSIMADGPQVGSQCIGEFKAIRH